MYELIGAKWAERIAVLETALASAADEQELSYRQRQIAWIRETLAAVVISEEQGEVDKFRKWGLDIIPHRKLMKEGYFGADGRRIDLEDAFKSEAQASR
ncbi:hypothetical protein [Phenylobacterium sp.]|jgi:type I restriction enzyme R subunit|uniref:hypothetical protein n=1 Tax=Phenylobacterium sp. TaxID=1871053 RepID=UPI002E3596FF|nr:hypothetical protein [Phenylobacterium sp.]HEX4709502.1 hypothetical protein [Phenylobacterium sp.]